MTGCSPGVHLIARRRDCQVLRSLLNAAGAGAVLLLEDVDAAFTKREAGENARNLTFSGVHARHCGYFTCITMSIAGVVICFVTASLNRLYCI